MNKIEKKYSPKEIENKWYEIWLKKKYFESNINNKKAYTIIMPPPNVTGILHIGHFLNNTLQDILIRKNRMSGLNCCWIPGYDHASIATEAKINKDLNKKGLNKDKIGKRLFLEITEEWCKNNQNLIRNQLKKIGVSCDWRREKFTMDDEIIRSVKKIFIKLYDKNLIYKDTKLVNWDCIAKTNISDEEINYVKNETLLYYIKYKIKNEDNYVIISTTRPETIFGDTCICINPSDKRYANIKNKIVIVPIVNKYIPIIEDEIVDKNFGTGCLKITPAHDFNDYQIGKKYNLDFINIMNKDGTMNEKCMHYNGLDRMLVRKKIVEELKKINCLYKTEKYSNNIGISERTGSIIEPMISNEWFLNMKEISKPAIDNILNNKIKLYPDKIKKTYLNWLYNIKDWNISRNLWWGHRIPVFYYEKNKFIVAESKEEALNILIKKNITDKKIENLKQEESVFDTWFSSWIWPLVLFNKFNNTENNELNYYLPSEIVISGQDIIFFWIIRMIIANYEFEGKEPFKKVYFTGIVRDQFGRKMSKSIGNSPDIIKLIDEYGSDSIRMGIILNYYDHNDLVFKKEYCIQGRNFCNKLWNILIFFKNLKIDKNLTQSNIRQEGCLWINIKLKEILFKTENLYKDLRISKICMIIYKFIWDDFCSIYLELIKDNINKTIDLNTYNKSINIFKNVLKLLHPFIPFITEEIWSKISNNTDHITISKYPEFNKLNLKEKELLKIINNTKDYIKLIRKFKVSNLINKNEQIHIIFKDDPINISKNFIIKMCNVIISTDEKKFNKFDNCNDIYEINNNIFKFQHKNINNNIDQQIQIINEELNYNENFLMKVQQKLKNENFIRKAPKKIIDLEKKKEKDIINKINLLKNKLKNII